MINTILWDFDGTLLNTNDVILESWQHTYEHYYGRRMPVEHITKCFGEPLLVTMAREFPDVPQRTPQRSTGNSRRTSPTSGRKRSQESLNWWNT